MANRASARDKKAQLTQGGAAHFLGVSRVHLNLCLHGKRTTEGLIERYRDLVTKQAAGLLQATFPYNNDELSIISRAARWLNTDADHLMRTISRQTTDEELMSRYRALAQVLTRPGILLSLIFSGETNHPSATAEETVPHYERNPQAQEGPETTS
jgi:hypothetical protein